MKTLMMVAALLCLIRSISLSQGQPSSKDTSAGLPRLEIPEITIVGKKAITLPFARKGEIYDVNIYEAPQPDTSLLESRPAIPLPLGSLPRYEEPLIPWHISSEGSLGSFTTGHLRGFVDYQGRAWGFYGNGGFSTTQGHTENAHGNASDVNVNAHRIVSTDNEILKTFRVSLGTRFMHDSYGMFGILGAKVDRGRSNINLDARLNSINRNTNAIDISFVTRIWSVTDSRGTSVDSQITVVSPQLTSSFASTQGDVRFKTRLSYSSSSLTYQGSAESPSLMDFSFGVAWRIARRWLLDFGGQYSHGSNSDGASNSLVAPSAVLRWELDNDRVASFWFQPSMHLVPYDEYVQQNPYLIREITLRSERTPINLGGSLWYNSGVFSLELRGSFFKTSDRAITIADSNTLRLEYVDANQFNVQADGTLRPTDDTRLKFSGKIQPAFEDGSTRQLPMIPIVQLAGRGEIDLHVPCTLWSSVEYWSKQNIDLAGSKILADRVLIGVGASTHAIPRTMLSLEISNLFNTAYEWWSGYVAPGRVVMFNAKVNLQ
ncbi:MAG: hypothetical protein HYR76_06515 [Ignavibacteria bacterium]|nr:hypothetical protein [Ignavibacteria bacterium]